MHAAHGDSVIVRLENETIEQTRAPKSKSGSIAPDTKGA
jgi:hypothetical protein